ncbi:MAG: hypothetical protein ABJA34_00930 [Pseudonocardiales bacterium]
MSQRWPAFVSLPCGSAATFVAAVLCGPGRLPLALLVVAGIVGGTAWVSDLWVGVGVAGFTWFWFVGFVVAGTGDLRLDHGHSLGYLAVLAVVALTGYLVRLLAAVAGRNRNRNRSRHRPIRPFPPGVSKCLI